MKEVVLASVLLFSVGSIQAAESIRWDSASLSYQTVELDEYDMSGFGISGTKLLNENIFVLGSYASVSDDVNVYGSNVDLEFNRLSLGLGYRYPVAKTTDLFGIVSYEKMGVEASYQGNSDDDSENGFGLQGGVRTLVAENIELSGALNYVDIGDASETGINLSAMYHFTEQFSASIGYGHLDDVDTVSVSAVFFF
ncbi:porin family protein [Shewanella sp. HL-SH2]|uniref:porin family protein n=1 Tax=Shewanella sp. HL-SH2 TaxID=3436238 RepID=UPI003EBD6342